MSAALKRLRGHFDNLWGKEYLNEIYKIGQINKHKQDSKNLTPKERFESLKDWQKETLIYYLKKYDIIEEYQKYGYYFDYLGIEKI